MIYVTKINNEALFIAYEPDTPSFTIDKKPDCPYEYNADLKVTWRCDIESKKVWYEVEYLEPPSQLDRMEETLIETSLEVQYLSALQELGI